MITIRRLQVGEADLYKQVRLAALHEAPQAFTTTYESALRRTPESWREQADSTAQGADRAAFIAFAEETPVGLAALYRLADRTDVGEVLQVWVAPEYRGQDVAQELMDTLFRWAAENRFRTVIAGVVKTNARALQFYRSYGFALAEDRFRPDPGDMVLMRQVESEPSSPAGSVEPASTPQTRDDGDTA